MKIQAKTAETAETKKAKTPRKTWKDAPATDKLMAAMKAAPKLQKKARKCIGCYIECIEFIASELPEKSATAAAFKKQAEDARKF